MHIKALRSSYGDYGSVSKGMVIDVPDARAQQLIKKGIFSPVRAVKQEDAKKASARPSSLLEKDSSRSGGRTGAGKQSSSSPAAPASTASTSIKSGDGHG